MQISRCPIYAYDLQGCCGLVRYRCDAKVGGALSTCKPDVAHTATVAEQSLFRSVLSEYRSANVFAANRPAARVAIQNKVGSPRLELIFTIIVRPHFVPARTQGCRRPLSKCFGSRLKIAIELRQMRIKYCAALCTHRTLNSAIACSRVAPRIDADQSTIGEHAGT